MIRRFRLHALSRFGRVAWTIVLLYGVMLGYFITRTFVQRLPQQYYMDFGHASWIRAAASSPSTYFRKMLYIPGAVQQAWIQIAATGNYELIVNNVILDQNQYPGTRESGMYDLKTLLSAGSNVIAVYVSGGMMPGTPELRVRGAYKVTGSPVVEFVSDPSWKASGTPDGIVHGFPWTSPALDDRLWADAVSTHGGVEYATVQPINFDPRLLHYRPVANWIMAADAGLDTANVSFDYTLSLPRGRVHEGWLQLAASGAYTVLVNGRLAAMTAAPGRALLFGPQAPVVPLNGYVLTSSQVPMLIVPSSGLPGSANLATAPRGQGLKSAKSMLPVSAGPSFTSSKPTTSNTSTTAPSTSGPAAVQTSQPSGATGPGATMTSGASTAPPRSSSSSSSAAATLNPTAGTTSPSSTMPPPTGSTSGVSSQPVASQIAIGQTLTLPGQTTGMTGIGRPDLTDLMELAAFPAPQLVPLSTTIGVRPAAPAMIAYDISNYLHGGHNRITIRVQADGGPTLLIGGGFADMGDRVMHRFATGTSWRTTIHADGRSGHPRAATVFASYDGSPWGPLPQTATTDPSLLPGQDTRGAARWAATLVLVIGGVLVLWFIPGALCSSTEVGAEEYWNFDALLQLPMLLGLILLWVIAYDVRLPADWCFKPLVIFGFLLALVLSKLLLLLPGRPMPQGRLTLVPDDPVGRRWLFVGSLVVIMLVGFLIRWHGMLSTSMGHDETAMANVSEGILKVGYPFVKAGSYTRWMATYELVPYPLALSRLIFGPTEFAYRLPSLIMGTLTIGLIGWVGLRMMDWRVGLLAALIYALLPIPTGWAQDGFYLSQEGLFALLMFWTFFEAIRDPGLNRRYVKLSAIFFVLTYLSWEGSGFVMPTLFVAIFVVKWGEFEWIADPHLWACFLTAAAVVILQLCFRQLVMPADFLGVVKDLSELTTPELVFLDRQTFDPFFYVRNLFLADNFAVLSLLAIAGLLFVRRSKALLYLFVCLGMLWALYTLLLAHYAPRYCFTWIALLVLAASGSLFYLWDRITALATTPQALAAAGLALGAGLVIIVVSSNPYWFKLYNMSANPQVPIYFDRPGVQFKPDYRDADFFVARHLRPGDKIIAFTPHVYKFDTHHTPDLAMDTMLTQRITFDAGNGDPFYIDKWLGIKELRSLDELERVRAKASRVWIIVRASQVNSPDVNFYLQANGQVAYDGILQRVIMLQGTNPVPLPPAATAARPAPPTG